MTVLNADIDYTIIPVLKEGEGLIIHVDVGNMPNHKALEYVERVRDEMLKVLTADNGNQYFFVPVRNGVKAVSITKADGEVDEG